MHDGTLLVERRVRLNHAVVRHVRDGVVGERPVLDAAAAAHCAHHGASEVGATSNQAACAATKGHPHLGTNLGHRAHYASRVDVDYIVEFSCHSDLSPGSLLRLHYIPKLSKCAFIERIAYCGNRVGLFALLVHDFHGFIDCLLSIFANFGEHFLEQAANSPLCFFGIYGSRCQSNRLV